MAEAYANFKDTLFFFFFPISYRRMYAQCAIAIALIVCLFLWSNYQISQQLLNHPITGRITDIKVGSKGGSTSGKYSGKSLHYHLQLAPYRRNFILSDASVFENWQFDAEDFEPGDVASFKISSTNEQNLQKPTEYLMQLNIQWPQEASSIKMYGLAINGKTILSTASSIRGQTYNRWFWVFVPLGMYAFVCLWIRTQFKYWTQAAEDRAFK